MNDSKDSKDQTPTEDYIAFKKPEGCLSPGLEVVFGIGAALIAIVIVIIRWNEESLFMPLVIMLGVVLFVSIGINRYWILASYIVTLVVLTSCLFTVCGM